MTAFRVRLDGRSHTTRVRLNPIATRAGTDARYEVQLMAGSLIFGLQRSTGLVRLDARVTLPVIARADDA